MPRLELLCAVILYLLPIVLFVTLRFRRDRALWEVALDIPFAVALDLIVILTAARFAKLETAILFSRVLWALGGALALVLFKRRRQLAWPIACSWRPLLLAAIAAAVALYISVKLSRPPCAIWDRQWHIPLTTSLLGQRLPFHNVYEPNGGLYYHFAGNVLAATLQALSFMTIHASPALSLAHDVMFALTGLTLALLLYDFGIRRAAPVLCVLVATLMTGPAVLLQEGEIRQGGGYSISNLLSLSFRPHVSLSELLMLGFAGSVLVRLLPSRTPISSVKTASVLIATTAVLAITDEASTGVLGVALGCAWLITPNVVHPERLKGIGILAALLGALALSSLLFVGSFGLGAPAHAVELVAWQSPGFYVPALPLSEPEGRRALYEDAFAALVVLFAGAVRVLRVRTRTALTGYAFFVALVAIALAGFTRIEVDGSPTESHRFLISMYSLSPLFAAYLLSTSASRVPSSSASFEALLVYVALAIPAASTLEWWISGIAELQCIHKRGFEFSVDALNAENCRTACGASVGKRASPKYMSAKVSYLCSGCVPSFISGPEHSDDDHKIKVGGARFGLSALRDLHENMLAPDTNLQVLCELGSTSSDPVCADAIARGECQKQGTWIQRCKLSPELRKDLLERAAATP
ncbi:MAG TPA: hypothetical protein VK524_05280 [Polyangiaceae bacterium]|nr:hypothetical protein [Polyangiaceae bacterium]